MSDRNLYPKGIKYQGTAEQVAYGFVMTNWGTVAASPAPACTMTDLSTNQTCTTATLSGSASLANNTITTPKVQSLEAGKTYRLAVSMTISGNALVGYMDIQGE